MVTITSSEARARGIRRHSRSRGVCPQDDAQVRGGPPVAREGLKRVVGPTPPSGWLGRSWRRRTVPGHGGRSDAGWRRGSMESPPKGMVVKVRCDLCGRVEDLERAIEAGWCPSYWVTEH